MTKEEFWTEYKKLSNKYPGFYPPQDTIKLRVMFDMVKSFDHRWMVKNVSRIILQNNPVFDWKFAAAAEIKSRNSIARTDALLNRESETSDNGLENALSKLGFNSLTDVLKRE